MKKKVISLLLALVMCSSLCITAMAEMVTDSYAENTEADEVLLPPGTILRGPKYHYKTVYATPVNHTVTLRASGQPTTGTVLEAGDGMTYYSYHASNVSVSVSCTLPAPYNSITIGVSIPIGSVNNSSDNPSMVGITKRVPTAGTYVLKVEKTYSVRGYVTYEARSGTNDWHYYASGGAIYDDNVLERPFLDKVG